MDKGYSWYIAVIFVFGETAGSGLVALPSSMLSLGLLGGILTLIAMGVVTFYTAYLLSNNWIILKSRWSEYADHCRNPYPEMGFRALGPYMAIFTNACCHSTAFGGGAVFALLAAKTLGEVLNGLGITVSTCTMLVAVGVILWPFIMLKSPMHFWQVSIVAAFSTLTAVVLIIIGYTMDSAVCIKEASYPEINPQSISSSLATIIFAYGGHPCIPTIIHDMKTPQHFFRTCLISYVGLFLIYAPVSIFGYWIYGSSVTDSVISSVQNDTVRRIVSILIATHVFFSILIIVNPLMQFSEHILKIKHEFGIGRFLVRTTVFSAIILSAAVVPNFGLVINLVGGSFLPFLVLILPVILAAMLEAGKKLENEGIKNPVTLKMILKTHPTWRIFLDLSILILGIWILINSMWNSILTLIFSSSASTMSCFKQWLSTEFVNVSLSNHFQCCGAFRSKFTLLLICGILLIGIVDARKNSTKFGKPGTVDVNETNIRTDIELPDESKPTPQLKPLPEEPTTKKVETQKTQKPASEKPEQLPIEKTVPEKPEQLPKEKTVPEKPEQLPKEKTVPEKPEQLPKEKTVPEKPEQLPKEKTVPEKPEQLPKEKTVPEKPEQLPKEKTVPEKPEQLPKEKTVPENPKQPDQETHAPEIEDQPTQPPPEAPVSKLPAPKSPAATEENNPKPANSSGNAKKNEGGEEQSGSKYDKSNKMNIAQTKMRSKGFGVIFAILTGIICFIYVTHWAVFVWLLSVLSKQKK
ncbi:unnamed protein product [Caenorhabditis bovis]|uniref:Amino acid transporter transmembrane domain-containing protein n=1 Tax=Caenorhabditis bovis TaxID=2654633 RepID=A0A8S1F7Z7_9PELO|nr:unnamed protein product [Caenorhabditis bovis]